MRRREFLSTSATAVLGAIAPPVLVSDPSLDSIEKQNLNIYRHPGARIIEQDEKGRILLGTMGFAATVMIDKTRGLVVKKFAVDGTSASGARPLPQFNNHEKMRQFYEKEKEALKRLKSINSSFINSEISFNDSNLSITTSFEGHDLLHDQGSPKDLSQADVEQILEMSHEYRQIGILKQNLTLSHLVRKENGKLIAIDFKWWEPRTYECAIFEIKSNLRWLETYAPTISARLLETMTDYTDKKFLANELESWKTRFEGENAFWRNRSVLDAVYEKHVNARFVSIGSDLISVFHSKTV